MPFRGLALTFLTGAVPEAASCAVTDEAVPSFLAGPVVLAGVAVTLFAHHLAAGRLDARRVLRQSDLSDVFAAPVDEEVTDAAHVAVVQHGGPELGGQH